MRDVNEIAARPPDSNGSSQTIQGKDVFFAAPKRTIEVILTGKLQVSRDHDQAAKTNLLNRSSCS